jgi:hypothetical protein
MAKSYLNFEIRIAAIDQTLCQVWVSAPGGDASETFTLPTADPGYRALTARLQILDADEPALHELGQMLFRLLFRGSIKDVYIRSQGMLGVERGLRLRFNVDPAQVAVAALPWEFLVDPDRGPLVLHDMPIVRYLPQRASTPTLKTSLPLKVLLTAAQTPPQTDVSRELFAVQAALADLVDDVQISVEPHLTTNKLQGLLREGFHIWHFVGHGGFAQNGATARLALEDSTGDVEYVSAPQLGILLEGSGVRLVVLDACEGARLATDPLRSLAVVLIRSQVPAVVAMQFLVPEETTRAFAGEFYRALAEGFPIDACVTEGRKAIINSAGLRRPDWGIPVVYTRDRWRVIRAAGAEADMEPMGSRDAGPWAGWSRPNARSWPPAPV